MIPIASWNVRGLNKQDHQQSTRALISSYNLQVCAFIETRVIEMNSSYVSSRVQPNWKWFFDYGNGSGRRIWVGWNSDFVDVCILGGTEQIIHCQIKSLENNMVIYVSFAYGLNTIGERRELWNEMLSFSELRGNDVWAVMGDFNAIIDSSEGLGGNMEDDLNDEFQACLTASDLITLPMEGSWFSWSNKQGGADSIWRRLDRVVANPVWFSRFPNLAYACTPPKTSDHSPIVFKSTMGRRGKNPWFRFDNFIAESMVFMQTVEDVWKHNIYGVTMYSVICKLKLLKPHFKKIKRRTGDLGENVKEASRFLEIVQRFLADNPTFEPLLELEKLCRILYTKAVSYEQSFLKQRAKIAWLKDGDQCTSFFFRQMAVRRARSRINRIEGIGGVDIDDPLLVRNEIVSFYENLLGKSIDPELSDGILEPFIHKKLRPEEALHMIRPVTAMEIKDVIFGFNDNKAPGPDGYNSLFFKRAWNVIGEEVTKAVSQFFQTGKMVKELNSTIISLIPKLEVPRKPKDFRPISCCNVLYKVISKIMANRLCESLEKLVDKTQTAFIPGRRINDNVLLAQELLHGYNQKNLPARCSFKVDLMKAYDTVEWGFVIEVLKAMNFHPTFIVWVKECMTTPSFSININGAAEGYFRGR